MKMNLRSLRSPLALLMCACIIAAALTGCKSDNDAIPGDRSKMTAEPVKLTNVYAQENFTAPDGYTLRGRTACLYDGRIYMYAERPAKKGKVESCIFSMDTNGGDHAFQPYAKMLSTAYIEIMQVTPDGSIVIVEYGYNAELGKNETFVVKNDADGNNVFTVEVTSSWYPDDMMNVAMRKSIVDMTCGDDGSIYLLAACGVIALSPAGEKIFDVPLYDPTDILRVGESIAVLGKSDGAIGEEYDRILTYIDIDAQKEGRTIRLPKTNMGDVFTYEVFEKSSVDDSDYICYVKTSVGLLGMSESGYEEIINWVNSGIDTLDVSLLFPLGGGKFYSASNGGGSFLSKVPDADLESKIIIKLAYIDGRYSDLTAVAAKFNRENPNYGIMLVTYRDEANSEVTPVSLMNNDIIAGNIPDMFLFDSVNFANADFSLANYEKKGMLVDLYEYINADSAFAADLLGCAKTPFERDGKLYRLVDELAIVTLIGKTGAESAFENHTLAEFLDIAEGKNGNTELMRPRSQSEFAETMTRFITEFVDEENGVCSFDDEVFVRFLDYIKTLPASFDYDSHDYAGEINGCRDGSILLMNYGITELYNTARLKAYFGANSLSDLDFVGYPGQNGGGAAIVERSSYAISAMSEKEIRDGAWEFIKFLINYEVPDSFFSPSISIPSSRAALEKLIQEEMVMQRILKSPETGYTSASGWSGGAPDPERIASETAVGGFHVTFTREEGDLFIEYLDSVSVVPSVSQKASEIINEEVAAYLGGVRSAAETAAIIQSRVAIYLSESH